MCDVVYVLLVERLERRALTERQVSATLAAAGAKGVKLVDPDEVRADFDRWLLEEPKPSSESRDKILRDALGLTG